VGTPDSSTNKTDCHDITEILLKVVLNTITLTLLHHHYHLCQFMYHLRLEETFCKENTVRRSLQKCLHPSIYIYKCTSMYQSVIYIYKCTSMYQSVIYIYKCTSMYQSVIYIYKCTSMYQSVIYIYKCTSMYQSVIYIYKCTSMYQSVILP
jgi:hypothetical protein